MSSTLSRAPVSSNLFLGLDVHKDTIVCAVMGPDDDKPRQIDTVPHDLPRLKKYFGRLAKDGVTLRCVYEASGGGYVLQRALTSWGYHCDVCAPSLTPQRPGHQRKHNRYDASELARYYRHGDLVLIALPTPDEERVRDLVRGRTRFQQTLHRARQQLLKFCTRRGLRYAPIGSKKTHWSKAHLQWLDALRADPALSESDRFLVDEQLALITYLTQRRDTFDARLETLVLAPALQAAVTTLQAFRGLEYHAALVLGSELRDWRRFAKGTEPMAYVGLVPREASSAKEHRGAITKMGNSHCRHVLVQAAWAYRHPPRVGPALKRRQRGVDARTIAQSWKAQHRLHTLYHRLAARRGTKVAVVAVARELVGFLWAAMTPPLVAPAHAA